MPCHGMLEAQKPSGECRRQTRILTEPPSSGGVRQQLHKPIKYFHEITLSSDEHNEEEKTGSRDGARWTLLLLEDPATQVTCHLRTGGQERGDHVPEGRAVPGL